MEHFPWQEILSQTILTLLGYYTGRYRNVYKNKNRRKDD